MKGKDAPAIVSKQPEFLTERGELFQIEQKIKDAVLQAMRARAFAGVDDASDICR